jgi:transposase-like protein
VARLKQKWQAENEMWSSEPLDDLEVVYLWVDGVYVKAGLEKDKAALLVVLAALSDGSKKILAVTPGHRESTQSWSSVLRDLKKRGLKAPTLVIGDGHLGIWAALRNVYPQVEEQRCWNHRILNVLDKIPARHQPQAILMLRSIPYAETRQEAERLRRVFEAWCEKNQLESAQKVLASDWSRMVTFYRFPKEHWPHLRTTNPVESPFAALRLRTDAAKRFKKVANATALIWRMLLVAEKRFRRIRSPHLAQDVYSGVKFVNGERVERREAVA